MDSLPLLYYLKYFILHVDDKLLRSYFYIYIYKENLFLMHKKYRRQTFAGCKENCLLLTRAVICLGMEKNYGSQFT